MRQKLCPKCNLNAISDGENLCRTCQEELGIGPSGLESIYKYILRVYDDFEQYLNSADKLCDLRNITFEGNTLPDYTNIHIQQLYILRYAYAYAYEYKIMYNELFRQFDIGSQITVTSIGCGNMIDYWSLNEALYEAGRSDCIITYRGLDIIDWRYKVDKRDNDKVYPIIGDAIQYFQTVNLLDSDIYIFPKSISEFSDYDFNKLCDCFKTKPILKDKFSLLISIRPVEVWNGKDSDRVYQLKNAICSNGFDTEDPWIYYRSPNPDLNINECAKQFDYPTQLIVDRLNNLTNFCKTEKGNWDCDQKCDKIDRSPMLTVKYVQYQKFCFTRKNEK